MLDGSHRGSANNILNTFSDYDNGSGRFDPDISYDDEQNVGAGEGRDSAIENNSSTDCDSSTNNRNVISVKSSFGKPLSNPQLTNPLRSGSPFSSSGDSNYSSFSPRLARVDRSKRPPRSLQNEDRFGNNDSQLF
jgi:hypothetical protein